MEISCVQSRYKESWTKIKDAGYKLRLDAIPFQSAKSSADIFSDVSIQDTIAKILRQTICLYIWLSSYYIQQKYKEQFEKTKGKMIGLKGLEDDINIAHSVHATKIHSDVSIRKITRTWLYRVVWSNMNEHDNLST